MTEDFFFMWPIYQQWSIWFVFVKWKMKLQVRVNIIMSSQKCTTSFRIRFVHQTTDRMENIRRLSKWRLQWRTFSSFRIIPCVYIYYTYIKYIPSFRVRANISTSSVWLWVLSFSLFDNTHTLSMAPYSINAGLLVPMHFIIHLFLIRSRTTVRAADDVRELSSYARVALLEQFRTSSCSFFFLRLFSLIF